MISDFTKKIKNYFNLGNNKRYISDNRINQSVDKLDELKKYLVEERNNISNGKNNKSINYKNQNENNILSNNNNCEENIINIIEENTNLFLEINDLKKEIELYGNRLEELNNEYNKLKQDNRDNILRDVTLDIIKIEKGFEKEFIFLEEEKYKLKLNHLLNINSLLKDQNQKAMKHNEQMKTLYKIYTGKNWNN